jgi:hypothetical protein
MKKPPLEVNFVYLRNKEIVFLKHAVISNLFSAKGRLCHKCIFFCLNNNFFIQQALKFKDQLCHLRLRDRDNEIKQKKKEKIAWGKNNKIPSS